jgi:hypothetical protein
MNKSIYLKNGRFFPYMVSQEMKWTDPCLGFLEDMIFHFHAIFGCWHTRYPYGFISEKQPSCMITQKVELQFSNLMYFNYLYTVITDIWEQNLCTSSFFLTSFNSVVELHGYFLLNDN